MSSTPVVLALMSPSPQLALERLGDGLGDVTIVGGDLDLTGHDAVLLSGDVTVADVARLSTELGKRPLTLAVDLAHSPGTAALTPLAEHYQGAFERWGDLPVALVEATGDQHVDPALLVGLAPVVDTPAPEASDVTLTRAALEHADREQERLQARLLHLRTQLERTRARTERLVGQRDAARERAHALEQRTPERIARRLRGAARRLPGGPVVGLLLLLLVGLAGVAVLTTLIAAGGDVALAAVVSLVMAALFLNLALTLWVLRRSGRAAAAVSDQLRDVRRAQRRMNSGLAGVRAQLDRQTKRHQNTHKNLTSRLSALSTTLATEHQNQPAERAKVLAQVQETIRLFTSVPVRAGVPPMGGWAASADLVGALVDEVVEQRPSLIVECGSGVSTLWMALAAQQHDIATRIVALEHDAHYAEQTRALLARHGVSHLAEVRHAPLRVTDVDGTDHTWYAAPALHDLADIGLLFVDGPPAAVGEHARYPALPLLQQRLAAKCSIVLDDMVREDEQEVAQLWHDRMPDLSRVDLRLEKGATIFRRG